MIHVLPQAALHSLGFSSADQLILIRAFAWKTETCAILGLLLERQQSLAALAFLLCWVRHQEASPRRGCSLASYLQMLIESKSTLHLLMQSFFGLKTGFLVFLEGAVWRFAEFVRDGACALQTQALVQWNHLVQGLVLVNPSMPCVQWLSTAQLSLAFFHHNWHLFFS